MLCYASILKIILECRKPHSTQKIIGSALLSAVAPSYCASEDIVSKLKSCSISVPGDVIAASYTANLSDVEDRVRAHVIPYIDESKTALVAAAILDTLEKDSATNDSKIGRSTKSELLSQKKINLPNLIANVLLFAADTSDNTFCKSFVDTITADYMNNLNDKAAKIIIEISPHVERSELTPSITLPYLNDIFTEIKHEAELHLINHSDLKLYHLNIQNSEFTYSGLVEYLLDNIGSYVYSRSKLKEFEAEHKERSIGLKAVRLMNASGKPGQKGTGNDLGEILLYSFLEESLNAPKILSKVEIKREMGHLTSKSDGVHLVKLSNNGKTSFQLIFGTSTIAPNITECVKESIKAAAEIKDNRCELFMVEGSINKARFDDETTAFLKKILLPSRASDQSYDSAFGIFIGYSLGLSSEEYSNDNFRQMVIEKTIEDIKSIVPEIISEIKSNSLSAHSFYFYFVPFNDADKDKLQIMEDLLGGA